MRFCLVSTQQQFGGGEVLLAAIAHELRRAGHTLGWIVREDSQVQESLQPQHGRILYSLQHRGRNVRDYRKVRQLLSSWAPDVVVMNDTHAVMLAGLAAAFCRRARPVRLAYKHTVFPLRSKLKYRVLADRVVCVSQAAQQTLVAGGLPVKETVVVYGGAARPQSPHLARDSIRQELQLPANTKLLVSVGSLLACKGHQDLLRALSMLPSSLGVHLAIAGEGPERTQLESLISQLGLQGRVHLLGYRQDANRLLAAADLIVHPSHAEGLSLVLIQAQMLMKPIVATAVGGAAEVLDNVRGRPTDSWVAAPHDAADLRQKIEAALAELQNQSNQESLRAQLQLIADRAHEKFSLQTNSFRLADVAASLL